MIERISRTRLSAADQPLRRDPRARETPDTDQAPIQTLASASAGKLPRNDVRADAQSRLRREMREKAAAPPVTDETEAKAERLDPRARRQGRVRADVQAATVAASTGQVKTAGDTIRRIENPSAYVFVVSIGGEAWSGGEAEMLGGARQIADTITGMAVGLLRIGVAQPDCDAGPAGADRLWTGSGSGTSAETATAYIVEAISRFAPHHVIFADGSVSGDIARRVAAELGERPAVGLQKLDGPAVVSRGNGGRSVFIRPAPRILVATSGLFDLLENAAPREARALEMQVPISTDTRVRDLGPEEMSVADVPLSEADFIISAGDGITDWPAFFDVADALSGVVGGSRQVCDAGLLPRHRQVGASGTLVEAKAYLALGISGAPQHLQGIQRCRFVAAVNTDLHAAMVKRADLAIIADAQQVMPELASLVREKRHVR